MNSSVGVYRLGTMIAALLASVFSAASDPVNSSSQAKFRADSFIVSMGLRRESQASAATLERSGAWSAWVVEAQDDWQCYVRPQDGAILSFCDYRAEMALYDRPPTRNRAIRNAEEAVARAVALAGKMGVDVAKLTDRRAEMHCDRDGADLDPNNSKDRAHVELRQPSPRGDGVGNVFAATFDVVTGDVLLAGGGQNLDYTSPQKLLTREEALAPMRAAFAAEREALARRGSPELAQAWEWPGDGFARDGMVLVTREAGAPNASGDYGVRMRERGELRTAWGLHVPATGAAVLLDAENGKVLEAELGQAKAPRPQRTVAKPDAGRPDPAPRHQAPNPVAAGVGIVVLAAIGLAARFLRRTSKG